MRRVALSISMLLLLGGWDWLSSEDPDVKAGNAAYSQGQFASALALYQRSNAASSKAALRFDAGAALYKLAESETDPEKKTALLERAETAFRDALESGDPTLSSAAHHNIGNSHFLRERWADAKAAYKKALRANQDNDDARYNLELVLRKMKKDKQSGGQGKGQNGDQPKQPGAGQQQKPQGQDGGNQDQSGGNQDQSGQGQDPQSQGNGNQTQDSQSDPSGADQDDQTKPGQGNNSGDPTAGQNPPPSPGQGQSSPQPQAGQGTPQSSPPSGGSGNQQNPQGADSDGEFEPGQGETGSERDRKLDALENRSRDLRRRRLRRGDPSNRRDRFQNRKDW